MSTHKRLWDLLLRNASGQKSSRDPLVGFLFDLMNRYVPPAKVEELVTEATEYDTTEFNNGFLADYAEFLAGKL